jgi:hypothetical protein
MQRTKYFGIPILKILNKKTMKMKIINILFVGALLALTFSCADESLDPLKFKEVKKGSVLALRGTQLQNIYFNGLPGADFIPTLLTGTEKFEFDAEYLSEDPTNLESFDVFVIKRNGSARERVFLKTVPFSEFKTTSDYLRPWVSVSINTSDILSKIGITPSYPLREEDVETLFETYKFGINLEIDLNLKDGSKVLASELVAAGLYQSNQFYPAQKLTYAVIKYCPEDLEGTYSYETTVTAVGDGGDISGCAGSITGEGELVSIALGVYSISDVTFGQYDCAWDDDPAEGATLKNVCDELSFGGSDQYGSVYTISGVKVSSDGTQLSFKWENDFGDKGTTVLTRTDNKLWPTTLFSAN